MIEKYKHSLIISLKDMVEDHLKDFEICCDDANTYRQGLSTGIYLAIECIKRNSNRRLIEYALDGYQEEHGGPKPKGKDK